MQSESYANVIRNKTSAYPIVSVNALAKKEDVAIVKSVVPARLEHIGVVESTDKVRTGHEGAMH